MIKFGEAAFIMEICQHRDFISNGELIMDKKAQKILMRYMDDEKRESLTAGEIAYAKKRGAILDDLLISCEQAVSALSQIFETVSLADAAEAFLYSLSTRDMEYRYILASYVYAASWLKFDRGRTDGVPQPLSRTFYNWVKYRGGGIWGEIGKPIYYLSDLLESRYIICPILLIPKSEVQHMQTTAFCMKSYHVRFRWKNTPRAVCCAEKSRKIKFCDATRGK